MRRRFRPARLLPGLLALLMAGCSQFAPISEPGIRLIRREFADLPGWNSANAEAALGAFVRSCAKIAGKPLAGMGGAGFAGNRGDWEAPCGAAQSNSGPAKQFFETQFAPFAITQGDGEIGLFTGYFEPKIAVSRTRHGPYQTPIYARPTDLIAVDLGAFRDAWRGQRIAGKVAGGMLVPYPDRAVIRRDGLPEASVLAYAADPVALFFLHIQGSGRALCDDGSEFRLAYDAQNGHAYTAIGKVLIETGAISREAMSMAAIADWLHAHPDEAQSVMDRDASYIFFHEEPLADPALGAKGSQGVPLTPMASLAVDPRHHAQGVPYFVMTTTPDGQPLNIVAVAQDRGGAIRGVVRADIYFGAGEGAGAAAGAMKQPGALVVLLPTALAAKIGAKADYPGGDT